MNGYVTPYTPDVTRINRPSDAELCMQACGCYRDRSGGYPGGSGFSNVTVSGRVTGVSGGPAINYPMNTSVNGRYAQGHTDRRGRYAVTGLIGSDISVGPQTQLGVTSYPGNYNFINLQRDAPNSDFTLRAVYPGQEPQTRPVPIAMP